MMDSHNEGTWLYRQWVTFMWMELLPCSITYEKSMSFLGVFFFFSVLYKCLLLGGPDRKVSHLYDSPFYVSYKDCMGNKLGIQIPDETWEEGLKEVNARSTNSRYCLIQFWVIHRLYSSTIQTQNFTRCSQTHLPHIIHVIWLRLISPTASLSILKWEISEENIQNTIWRSKYSHWTWPWFNHTGNYRFHMHITKITAAASFLEFNFSREKMAKKRKEVSTYQMWHYEMICSIQIRFSLKNRES